MPPPATDAPWAKLAYAEDGTVRAALPLADHGFDVAAAMAALLGGAAWDAALVETAGRALTWQDRARLVALAALHDIGKVNRGFQARRDPAAPRIGHEGPVAALLEDTKLGVTDAGQALRAISREWGANHYLAALMAHHGRPRDEFRRSNEVRSEPWQPHVHYWKPAAGYDPVAQASALIAQVRARWPLAWETGDKLPQDPRFVSLFAGLMTLADWLGSDTGQFPVDGPYGDARERMRIEHAGQMVAARGMTPLVTPPADFAAAFGFEPRGVQREAAADDLGPVALIEAETGSGKTEAALWRWLALRRAGHVDGLFFALPTRSAAVQLHARIRTMLGRVWGDHAPEAVLAVPGYIRAGDHEGQSLPGWEVRWDDGINDARWAAERSNRFLAARIAVGTIDQALLGALKVRHAHVRAATLARSLLVVDEVHASDAYMARLLERLLDNHVAAGGHALLLSATLGGAARARLLGQPVPTLAQAVAQPYPALAGRNMAPRRASAEGTVAKQVRIEIAPLIDSPDAIAARAVDAACAGASVLVVRNSVGGAIAVAQAVAALADEAGMPDLAFRVNRIPTLHHGRFAADDRRLLDREVERQFGRARSAAGRVLVGTQTLEQSLDLDADLLITDLAPVDVLLQRIGRLHRHPRTDRGAFGAARAIVLRPPERDLSRLLGRVRDRHGLGPMQDGRGVYPDLRQLEATLRLLEGDPIWSIPDDNRRLVEHALHPEVLDAIATELGTDWANHAADRAGFVFAEQGVAADQSLDLSVPFRDLTFPAAEEAVATRLGARDLLVDFAAPLPGPFGPAIPRIAIPHWMARGIAADVRPEPLAPVGDTARFRLGDHLFAYGRWGLTPVT